MADRWRDRWTPWWTGRPVDERREEAGPAQRDREAQAPQDIPEVTRWAANHDSLEMRAWEDESRGQGQTRHPHGDEPLPPGQPAYDGVPGLSNADMAQMAKDERHPRARYRLLAQRRRDQAREQGQAREGLSYGD